MLCVATAAAPPHLATHTCVERTRLCVGVDTPVACNAIAGARNAEGRKRLDLLHHGSCRSGDGTRDTHTRTQLHVASRHRHEAPKNHAHPASAEPGAGGCDARSIEMIGPSAEPHQGPRPGSTAPIILIDSGFRMKVASVLSYFRSYMPPSFGTPPPRRSARATRGA